MTTHHRHPTHHRHTNRITTAITHAIGWILTNHDDRIPNRIQTLIWFAALTTLFVCLEMQR